MALVAMVITTAGCGRSLSRSGAEATAAPTPRATVSTTTTGAEESPDAVASAVPADQGTLSLRLFDDNGVNPKGIPVAISGRRAATVNSNADGVVTFSGPPGRYAARVVTGCHRDVLVHDGGNARLGIVGNRTTTGELRVDWEHRYGPSHPVSADAAGDWPVGDPIGITYGVTDRCSDERAPDASLPTYTFDLSSNLDLASKPTLRANGEGLSKVTVVCRVAGSIKLVLRDDDNPSDVLDLGRLVTSYGGTPRCAD